LLLSLIMGPSKELVSSFPRKRGSRARKAAAVSRFDQENDPWVGGSKVGNSLEQISL
jgi:hypothetical protein